MPASQVVFHADVGREEGWGHLRECLSMAEAMRRCGVACGFVLPAESRVAGRCVRQEGYPVWELPARHWQARPFRYADGLLECVRDRFLVTNLVRVPAGYAPAVSRVVRGWAVVTEHARQELAPLNFNICEHVEYMPLHVGYRRLPPHRINPQVGHMLVCFGGSDPQNACGLSLEMLRQGFERGRLHRALRLTVVVGPLCKHRRVLRALSTTYPVKLDVVGPLKPESLVRLACAADLALTTGGGTMYEFCAAGLPSIVVPILGKMDANASVLCARGAVRKTVRVDRLAAEALVRAVRQLLDPGVRRAMSQAAQAAVDGCGAERMMDRFAELWGVGR